MPLAQTLLWALAATWKADDLDHGNRMLQSGPGYEIRLHTVTRPMQSRLEWDQLLWIRSGGAVVSIAGRIVKASPGDLVKIPRSSDYAIEPASVVTLIAIRIKPLAAGRAAPPGIRPAQGEMADTVTRDEIATTIARTEANAPLHTQDNFTVNYVLFKGRVGPWESHAHCADIYLLQSGSGVIQLGGAIENAKDASPGEPRGTALRGAREHEVAARGLLVIPRGVAHHMNPKSLPLAYVLIKVWSE